MSGSWSPPNLGWDHFLHKTTMTRQKPLSDKLQQDLTSHTDKRTGWESESRVGIEPELYKATCDWQKHHLSLQRCQLHMFHTSA